jgi:hypothetical protein
LNDHYFWGNDDTRHVDMQGTVLSTDPAIPILIPSVRDAGSSIANINAFHRNSGSWQRFVEVSTDKKKGRASATASVVTYESK